jgi:hypothetical protein
VSELTRAYGAREFGAFGEGEMLTMRQLGFEALGYDDAARCTAWIIFRCYRSPLILRANLDVIV